MPLFQQLGPAEWAVVLILPALLLAVVVWLLVIGTRLRRLEAGLPLLLANQQRDAAEDLHAVLERHTDRVRAGAADDARAHRDTLQKLYAAIQAQFATQRQEAGTRLAELAGTIATSQERLRGELLEQVLTTLAAQARADRELLQAGLQQASTQLGTASETLSRTINERLEAIGGHVNQRLDEGFRQTNETFASVMARLATIDEAQKKIDGLTGNVISLQTLLGDKRARGAFGEVQLEALVKNALPPDAYSFQHVLPNGTRVDCLLRLPEPTGWVPVDAKFPLENYHRMLDTDPAVAESDRRAALAAFRADLRRHVDAIADKYILPGVTADGAVMFVPAEAVFAEIHAHQPELVAHAQARRVWIVSPTTLMAVLNTARAVLKDVEMRKQVHVIKDALARLARDFGRFDARMEALARHIEQANKDVQDVQVSARKISAHFHRIESAELDALPEEAAPQP